MPERRTVTRWVLRGGLVVVAAVLVYVVVTAVQVYANTRTDDRDNTGAIVVLGAAQYDGRPSPVLQDRLDHALELYRDGVAPLIVLTGNKQPTDRFTEAFAGFRYLKEHGVPEAALRIVDDGSSTWDSLAAAERILKREGVTRATLVSDSYHSKRLKGIASELGIDAQVSPTDGSPTVPELARETALVSVGQIIGYGRLLRFAS